MEQYTGADGIFSTSLGQGAARTWRGAILHRWAKCRRLAEAFPQLALSRFDKGEGERILSAKKEEAAETRIMNGEHFNDDNGAATDAA